MALALQLQEAATAQFQFPTSRRNTATARKVHGIPTCRHHSFFRLLPVLSFSVSLFLHLRHPSPPSRAGSDRIYFDLLPVLSRLSVQVDASRLAPPIPSPVAALHLPHLTSPRTAPTTALHIWIGISSKPRSRAFQLIFRFPPITTTTTTQPPTQVPRSELRSGRGTSRHLLLHHSRITFPYRTELHRHHPLFHHFVTRCLCCSTSLTYPRQRRRLAFFDRLPLFDIDRSPFASINFFLISPVDTKGCLWLALFSIPGSPAFVLRDPLRVGLEPFPLDPSNHVFLHPYFLRHSRDLLSERRRNPPECSSFDTIPAHICFTRPLNSAVAPACASSQIRSDITVIGRPARSLRLAIACCGSRLVSRPDALVDRPTTSPGSSPILFRNRPHLFDHPVLDPVSNV